MADVSDVLKITFGNLGLSIINLGFSTENQGLLKEKLVILDFVRINQVYQNVNNFGLQIDNLGFSTINKVYQFCFDNVELSKDKSALSKCVW